MSRKTLRYLVPLAILSAMGAVPMFMSSGQVDAQTSATQPPPVPEGQSAVHFDVAKIANLVGGVRYDVNAAFAERVGRAVPVYFALTLPQAPEISALATEAPENGIVKFSFVTGTEPQLLIENMHFVEATVALSPEPERLEALGAFLSGDAVDQATQGFENVQKVALRRVQVGSYAAAELSGSYLDPELGPMNLRILAIPDPDSERAVIVVNNGVGKLLPLKTPDDLRNTFAGKALSTFRFLPQN